MKKKILGLLVALCLIVGMLPMAVLADDPALTIGQAASFTKDGGAVNGYYLDANNQQIPFGPAPFWYALSGAGSANWQETNEPKLVMNPGDPIKYFTTGNYDTSNATLSYMKETTDTANWNVKIEYPMGGTPTLTLKGANITNGCGIWYGFHKTKTTAPLNIVVESDSTIDVTAKDSGNTTGSLVLCTTGDVTITGSGKLTLRTNNTVGAICSYGNLTLDNANINIKDTAIYQKGNFLNANTGDITIKGGTLYCDGVFNADGWPHGSMKFMVLANDLTIQDGAKVTMLGSIFNSYDAADAAIKLTGKMTIKESDVELASCGGMADNLFVEAPTLEGVTATASGGLAIYNEDDGTYTAPTTAGEYKEASAKSYLYFKTVHTCKGGTATCEAKAVCDVCGEEYGEKLPHTYERTDCSVDSICEVCNQVAVAAGQHDGKDDGDCTTAVKCSGCGVEVTAAKSAHTYTDDKDTTCNNPGCTKTRTVSSGTGTGTGTGNGSTATNPETGDSTNLVMLFTLLAVSTLGLASVLVFKKKVA